MDKSKDPTPFHVNAHLPPLSDFGGELGDLRGGHRRVEGDRLLHTPVEKKREEASCGGLPHRAHRSAHVCCRTLLTCLPSLKVEREREREGEKWG